jgi:hypothetical protein
MEREEHTPLRWNNTLYYQLEDKAESRLITLGS